MPGKREREQMDPSEVISLLEQKIPCRTEQMQLLSMVIAQVKYFYCWIMKCAEFIECLIPVFVVRRLHLTLWIYVFNECPTNVLKFWRMTKVWYQVCSSTGIQPPESLLWQQVFWRPLRLVCTLARIIYVHGFGRAWMCVATLLIFYFCRSSGIFRQSRSH